MNDLVLAAGLEFEAATLGALAAMERSDRNALAAEFLHWADAIKTIRDMPREEFNRCVAYVANRGRIAKQDVGLIAAAMERFAAEHRIA